MLLKKVNLKKLIIYILIIISSISLLLSYMHTTLNLDEEYTMGLIQHSYNQLVNINMLDVHPPTYYLILKFLLNIFTFWTKSLFIKIIIARCFSLLTFIMSFIFLRKLLLLLKIKINFKIAFFFYLLMPSISMYATDIRMYSMYSLFNILVFYELIKFNKFSNRKYIIFTTVFALLASYVDYFSAVCAGIFIFIFFVKYLIEKDKRCIYLLLSGISLLILSIPLIFILIKQVNVRLGYSSFSMTFNNVLSSFTQTGVNSILISIIGTFILIGAILWSWIYLNKTFNEYLFIVLLNYILTTLLSIIICSKVHVYESCFTFPQFSIYSFLFIVIMLMIINKYHKYIFQIFLIFTLICMFLFSGKAFHYNIKEMIIPSYEISKQINDINKCHNKNIIINYNSQYELISGNFSKPLVITQESMFFKNKKMIILHGSSKYFSKKLLNGNSKLLTSTFNNLYFKK